MAKYKVQFATTTGHGTFADQQEVEAESYVAGSWSGSYHFVDQMGKWIASFDNVLSIVKDTETNGG